MLLPKISAVLNNCGLHAITPELCSEIVKFSFESNYNNQHNAYYVQLKKDFAQFYGFNSEQFSWKQFAAILQCYNPFDLQLVLGPVLRQFMKTTMADHIDLMQQWAECNIDPESTVNALTNIDPETGRFSSLSPDEIAPFICTPLGFHLTYEKDKQSYQLNDVDNPIASITLYHQGGIEGAKHGGHWERTPRGEGSVQYENQEDTQLLHIAALLGQDPQVNYYGFMLLKKQVQLTALSLNTNNELIDDFNEINLSAIAIARYLLSSCVVYKQTAKKLLRNQLTHDALDFIEHYQKQETVDDPLKKEYEKILNGQRIPNPYQKEIINRLTAPINLPKIQSAKHHSVLVQQSPSSNIEQSSDYLIEEKECSVRFDELLDVVNGKREENIPNIAKEYDRLIKQLLKKSVILEQRQETYPAQVASDLYNELSKAGVQYFSQPQTLQTYTRFKKTCEEHMESAREILEEFRGMDRWFFNMANFFARIIHSIAKCFGGSQSGKRPFLFFKPDTAQIVDEIENKINSMKP